MAGPLGGRRHPDQEGPGPLTRMRWGGAWFEGRRIGRDVWVAGSIRLMPASPQDTGLAWASPSGSDPPRGVLPTMIQAWGAGPGDATRIETAIGIPGAS